MSFLPEPPSRAARSAPWWETDLVALDFEATGLDFARDRIVSFGTVPIHHARIDLGQVRYELVDPGDVEPHPATVVVHGLRSMDLRGEAVQSLARESLRRELAKRFVVAWHASVEIAFLRQLYGSKRSVWRRRVLDVRDLIFELRGEAGLRLTLTEAAESYAVPVASPHHALDDALVTAQLFIVCATKLRARGIRSVADLLRLGQQPDPVLRRPRAPQ